MAIDTREKRQSLIGIQIFSGPSPTPNASPDKEWRQEVGYGYPGIATASPGGGSTVPVKFHHYQMVGGL